MKKLSMLLALMLVATCCMLASCGGDEETSSTASVASSVEASSEAASSIEETSSAVADVSSEAESSVEESSEAESSIEESSEAAPAVEATEGVEPSGDNLALNATITGVDVNGNNPAYSASLNDGAAADELTYDNNWFAYLYNAGAPDQANAPGGVGTMLIDLGEVTEITAVRLHAFLGNDAGITAPLSVKFEYSEDGENFVTFGEKTFEKEEAGVRITDWVGYTLSAPVNAQYVRVSVTLNGVWAFLNEVEVY